MTIRRQPADFVVEEVLAPEYLAHVRPPAEGAEGKFALYELRKESLTTPDAVGRFSRLVGAGAGKIEYAGLKDKHAVTVQHVTVPWSEHLRDSGEDRGLAFRRIGFVDAPIDAQAIHRNRFTIVVRDLSKQASAEMDRRAGLLAEKDEGEEHWSLLVVNYFGDQRFGSARHKQGWVARALIDGDFESALKLAIGTPARKDTGKTRLFTRMLAAGWETGKAGRWNEVLKELPKMPERRAIEALAAGKAGGFKEAFTELPYFLQQMYVEAYQSHLWNATARRLIEQAPAQGGGEAGKSVLRSTDAFGDLVFPAARGVEEKLRSLELPLLASKTALADPWAGAARAALADEGVQLEQLRIPGLRRPFFGEALRPLFVRAEHFAMSEAERDELSGPPPAARRGKRTVRFELPRGAYATVVLRALGQ